MQKPESETSVASGVFKLSTSLGSPQVQMARVFSIGNKLEQLS